MLLLQYRNAKGCVQRKIFSRMRYWSVYRSVQEEGYKTFSNIAISFLPFLYESDRLKRRLMFSCQPCTHLRGVGKIRHLESEFKNVRTYIGD